MKDKSLVMARLEFREKQRDGTPIPDDEMQADFCISTGDLDGMYSRMDESTLKNFAEDAERSVPFMLNHQISAQRQLGRTIAASYEESRVLATVSVLRDTDATPEDLRVNEYIRRMERGYLTSVSVGYSGSQEICDLCDKDIWEFNRSDACEHIPGRLYEGQRCTYTVKDARLREVSLVAVGANPNAKLLDIREWPEDLRNAKTGAKTVDSSGMSLLEQDGLKYRNGLIEAALKSGIRAVDNFDEDIWRERFEQMGADFIEEQTRTWDELGDARWGTGGRKTSAGTVHNAHNSDNFNFHPDVLKHIYE